MRSIILFACILAAVWTLTARGEVAVAPRTTGPAAVYEPYEWTIKLDQTYQNPFDPAEVAVDVVFTSPAGKALRMPAFWYQPFGQQPDGRGNSRLTPAGEPMWLVRFSPTVGGQWKLSAIVKDKAGEKTSAPVSFTVEAGKRPGLVRKSSSSPRYFQFDSGQSYFMVGLNVGWPGRRGLADYEDWFGKLHAAGGNFARVWLAAPNRMVETKDTGLGRYDLAALAHYDRIFELAEKNNIYIMLALANHRELLASDAWGTGGWAINPYNAVNKGPATRPVDYVTDPLARELQHRRLRYLVARYAAYTSLGFWELWNEQDLVRFEIPPAWTQDMAQFLKATDPYGRLVTTSYAGKHQAAVWKMDCIDLVQTHLYGDGGSIVDFPQKIGTELHKWDVLPKPHLLAEFGIDWRGPDGKYDPQGKAINLHNGLWSAVFDGAAGSGFIWWWDNYVGPKNLWGQFTPLAKFVETVDWAKRDFRSVEAPVCELAPGQPATFDDLTLYPTAAWEKSKPDPMVLGADGRLSGKLPLFFFGPAKKDMAAKLTMTVNMTGSSKLTVRVAEVSDSARLQVWVDGKPVADWPFSAAPGGPDQKSNRTTDPNQQHHFATYDVDRSVEIPAGRHTIAIDNIAGDWLKIGSISLAGAMPSHARIRRHVLADAASGQVIAWLHDVESNWKNVDQAPRTFTGLMLRLPVSRGGTYKVQWWDTATGQVIRTDNAAADGGFLRLNVPALTRDLAISASEK